jgi:tetratricopeptide (TPR) repeat protein
MKQTPRVPNPSSPDRLSAPDSDDADSSAIHIRFLNWLKHFALYLGAVTMAGMIGLYFLWQIPVPRDPAQLFKGAGDTSPPRTLTAVMASSAPVNDPTVASPSVPSPTPVPASAEIITAPPPVPGTETTDDPNVAPPPPEPQATPPDDQTDPPVEVLTPTTPQMEIEKLLADAQQQINSRRFTAPASGNALNTYQRILEIQPDQPAALAGIQSIASYYRDAAQQSLQQGRLDESLGYINRGLRATPKNDALINLRQEARRAKQREREAQQALREEAQRRQDEQDRLEQLSQEQEQPPPWWRQPAQTQESGFNQR